jgi:hypothetical protein
MVVRQRRRRGARLAKCHGCDKQASGGTCRRPRHYGQTEAGQKRRNVWLHSLVHNVKHVVGMTMMQLQQGNYMVAEVTEETNSRHNMMAGDTGMITGEGSGHRIRSSILSNTERVKKRSVV